MLSEITKSTGSGATGQRPQTRSNENMNLPILSTEVQRQAFEAELTGELASIGIEERAAQAHIAQFWTGNGYNTHELQSRWLEHCRVCSLPDDCRGCPHAGADVCCGGAV